MFIGARVSIGLLVSHPAAHLGHVTVSISLEHLNNKYIFYCPPPENNQICCFSRNGIRVEISACRYHHSAWNCVVRRFGKLKPIVFVRWFYPKTYFSRIGLNTEISTHSDRCRKHLRTVHLFGMVQSPRVGLTGQTKVKNIACCTTGFSCEFFVGALLEAKRNLSRTCSSFFPFASINRSCS